VLRLIAVWLMADGAWTAVWFSGLADSMGGRDAMSVTAMLARLIVAALSLAAGWLVSQRRPAGVPLGVAASVLIAIFSLIDAGTGVLPSNLDPSFRWPAAGVQVMGAIVATLLLRRQAREKM
jgi:hypothetical protein